MTTESMRPDTGGSEGEPPGNLAVAGAAGGFVVGAAVLGGIYGAILGAMLDRGAPIPFGLFTGTLGAIVGGLVVGPIAAVTYATRVGDRRRRYEDASARPDGERPSGTDEATEPSTRRRIAVAAIIVVLAVPLVAAGINRAAWIRQRTLPTAESSTVVTLTPDEPVAVVESFVTLRGGRPGFRGLFDSHSRQLDTTTSETSGVAIDLTTVALDPASTDLPSIGKIEVADCTDCTLRFRTVASLAEPATSPATIELTHTFDWSPDGPAFADEVPTPDVKTIPVDVTTTRVVSNTVTERLRWDPDRPFDTRLITVDLDPTLVSAGAAGVDRWPPVYRRSIAVSYRIPESGRSVDLSPSGTGIEAGDIGCHEGGCTHYSYRVPLEPGRSTDVAEPVDFELRIVHWIDYFDGAPRDGTIEVSSVPVAPGAWTEAHASYDTPITSEMRHTIEVTVDAGPPDPNVARSGIATFTVDAPPDAFEVMHSPTLHSIADGRYGIEIHKCADQQVCTIEFSVWGRPGESLPWSIDAYVGHYGTPTPPAGSGITISAPRITVDD